MFLNKDFTQMVRYISESWYTFTFKYDAFDPNPTFISIA